MNKKLSIALAIIALILIIIAQEWSKKQSLLFIPENQDLSDATRFVFLSEKNKASALVIDLQENQLLGRLALQAPIDILSINKTQQLLIFSHKNTLYLQNLKQKQQKTHQEPQNISHIANQDQALALITGNIFKTYQLPEMALIKTEDLKSAPLALHPLPLEQSWIILHAPNKLSQINNQETTNTTLPYDNIHPSAIASNNKLLAFQAQKQNQHYAVLWDIKQQRPHLEIPIPEPSLRPIFNQQENSAYFTLKDGTGLILNTDGTHQHFQSLKNPQDIKTAFNDHELIIKNTDTILRLNTDTLQEITHYPLQSQGTLFINYDSKNILFYNPETLYKLSLPRGKLQTIALPKNTEPSALIMGASATLCH